MEHKIAWVNWSHVCKSKELGGLGIKDLTLFNKALIRKWKWRSLNEANGLWYKVIKAQSNGGVCASPWWREVNSLCFDDNVNWFEASLKKTLGEGDVTVFGWMIGLALGHLRGTFIDCIICLRINMLLLGEWEISLMVFGVGNLAGGGNYGVGKFCGCRTF